MSSAPFGPPPQKFYFLRPKWEGTGRGQPHTPGEPLTEVGGFDEGLEHWLGWRTEEWKMQLLWKLRIEDCRIGD